MKYIQTILKGCGKPFMEGKKIRWALHMRSRTQKKDRLLCHQRTLAQKLFGFDDDDPLKAVIVEALFARPITKAFAAIQQLNGTCILQHFEESF